ncbi:MAG TPA: MraY family glycosyltransferase [Candidatus Limnocylindrales bacterium]|nr:MraY family glycosyltransferase [Candidatus Limnocylindrales bacterium]
MRFGADVADALPILVGAFVVAALVSLVLTPLVRRVAARFEVVDHPDPRRVNRRPVPRGGGIAVAAAFVPVSIGAVVLVVQAGVPLPPGFDGPALIALLAGAVAAAMIGAIDDYLQIRARWQLAGQVALACWAVVVGVSVTQIANPFGGLIMLGAGLGAVFTVVWIVGMINSINFIDGLDGLSSGVTMIAAVTLGVISLTTTVNQPVVAVLCFALAGALAGFLRWNFHPATIFVGTSGVMLMGYSLAILSILGTAKVAVAVLALGVPIIDTFWIIVRRILSRRSPFSPDRGHIHHRLLDLGLSHTQAVVAIYGLCIALAVLSLVLSGSGQVYAFLGVFLVLGVTVFILARRSLRAEELEASSYEEPTSAG